MIDEQSSASGHDYASDRSAIGDGLTLEEEELHVQVKVVPNESHRVMIDLPRTSTADCEQAPSRLKESLDL